MITSCRTILFYVKAPPPGGATAPAHGLRADSFGCGHGSARFGWPGRCGPSALPRWQWPYTSHWARPWGTPASSRFPPRASTRRCRSGRPAPPCTRSSVGRLRPMTLSTFRSRHRLGSAVSATWRCPTQRPPRSRCPGGDLPVLLPAQVPRVQGPPLQLTLLSTLGRGTVITGAPLSLTKATLAGAAALRSGAVCQQALMGESPPPLLPESSNRHGPPHGRPRRQGVGQARSLRAEFINGDQRQLFVKATEVVRRDCTWTALGASERTDALTT
jgi:hypothetical protein